jgi:hypothetical protein
MKILETRKREAGFTYRRYRRDDGSMFATYELPATVVKAVGMGKVMLFLQVYRRGEAARERAAKLRAAVAERKGWKATAVAHDLNITEARVRQIRKELQC